MSGLMCSFRPRIQEKTERLHSTLGCTPILKSITETSPYKSNPELHLTYSKNGGNLGLVLKIKNIACIAILLTKHVKYTYLYLFKFVLYSIVAFKANW